MLREFSLAWLPAATMLMATAYAGIELRRLARHLDSVEVAARAAEAHGAGAEAVRSELLAEIARLGDELRQLQQAQTERGSQLRSHGLHLEQTPLGVIEWDMDFRVCEWNRAAEKIFGYSRAEAIGQQRLDFLVPPASREHVGEVWAVLLAQRVAVKSGNENCTRDGRTIFCEWHNTPLIASDGAMVGIASIVQDITSRRDEELAIHRMAYHDPLTGLPNRALMHDRLEQALKQARRNRNRAAILFLDLDHFKQVNDRMGHSAGDELLRQVAQRLAEAVREGDTVARLGGDEFVVILSDIYRADDAERAAEKILRALARPVQLQGEDYAVTTSIGISVYPDHGASGEALLKHADMAMYRAKRSGRNTVEVFSAELLGT